MTHSEVSHRRWTSPDERVAAKWIDERDRTDRMLMPFGQRMLDVAALAPGERVLDIGCGSGATTLAAWERVAPSGSVTGVDISTVMLDLARTRVQDVTHAGIAWLEADAERYPFSPNSADVAISRFGVGHFSNTVAAFVNIRKSLREGGRFVLTEWTTRSENEWMSLPRDVARRVLPKAFKQESAPPEHASDFADGLRLQNVLQDAGFDIRTFERYVDGLWVGTTPADVLNWFARIPEGRLLESLGSADREKFLDELRIELEHRTRADGVYLSGTAWMVDCRNPLANVDGVE